MKIKPIIFLIISIEFGCCLCKQQVNVKVDSSSSAENDTFVPTKEWQVIREGQSIPPGLHVKLNLETGVREAKLLDENETENEDKKSTQLKIMPEKIKINSEETLEDAIKKANEDLDQIEWISQEQEEHIKKKYKDYKQLKKDYEEMKSNFKTDFEVINELLDEFNNTRDDETQSSLVNLLSDLNYLVHQIDNAVWFIDAGGLHSVILPMIVNQTILPYRIASLRLLGALTQNNPKAQVKVYENNFGSYLSNVLLQSDNSDELSAAVYALGSLLRKFPLAQKEILSQFGTKALISVLQKDIELKVKVKVLTLISDLIIDKESILQNNLSNTLEPEKINQYNEVNLYRWLIENQYCPIVIEFMIKSYGEIVRKADIAEDIVLAMNTTYSPCQKLWAESDSLLKILKSIEINFRTSGNEYHIEVGEKFENLQFNIGGKYEIHINKDEL